jgi:hypothetical protein
MLQKLKNYLSQFSWVKHTVASLYGAFGIVYATNGDFSNYVNTTALELETIMPAWLLKLVVFAIIPLIAFYHQGFSKVALKIPLIKSVSMVFLCLILMSLTTGCSQTSITTAVKLIVTYEPNAASLAQEAGSIVGMFDPSTQAQEQQVTSAVVADLGQIEILGNQYLAAPSTTTWASIVNLVNTITVNTDQQLLDAAHITDTVSQAKAEAILGAIDLAVHVIDGYVQKAQPASAVQATAAARTLKLKQISRYWPSLTPDQYQDLKMGETSGF